MTTSEHSATPGAFSIEGFAKRYGIGRVTVYGLIGRGELESFQIGRRRLISHEAALRWQRAAEARGRADAA